jgi:tRNA(Glu) U13 pseudouridine synthase TruD
LILQIAAAAEAREYYQRTKDIKGTLAKLPKFMNVERQILQGLQEYGTTNYLTAIYRVCTCHTIQAKRC